MKDQPLKNVCSWLALASLFVTVKMFAVSFNDIQFWTGSGTNRAALVIEWSAPEDLSSTSVPAPIPDKSLVWGYRFNDLRTAEAMLDAIAAADPRLYVVKKYFSFGHVIYGLGFHLNGGGDLGITDGNVTNFFTNGLLTNSTVDIDAAAPLNLGDIYWGGWNGPSWELWTEAGGNGGFPSCPDRGTNTYWTSTDPDYFSSGYHGQWDLAYGVSSLQLTNGSWIGFSVSAGPYDWDNSPSAPYNAHKHAPALPDPSITALVKNFAGGWQSGQWQAQFISCTNWNYALERSTNLQSWITVTNGIPGNGIGLNLADPAPPAGKAFYRVRAEQP